MKRLTRQSALDIAAAAALVLALALPAGVLAAAATPKYTKESKQAYEAQLNKGEIAEAVFNKPVRSLRLTLKDGRHVLYTYEKKGSQALEEQLAAKGVTATQLKGTGKKKHKAAKHKRLYIAIAVLVVLVLIGGALLLMRRRRLGGD